MATSDRTSKAPPLDEAIALIGGYTIVKKLGEGGAGRVYACRDEKLGRLVAIKVLHAQNATDRIQRERFLREARAMARVSSPHIVGVHQVGEHKRGPYLVMEYLDGEDLETRLRKRKVLDVGAAVAIIRQVALGLEAADAAGIVHRDVKPANIIIVDDKVAKLTDFGLARPLDIDMHVTTEGTFAGTAAFLAPERARGQPDDKRADMYALGCTLYTLLKGEPPFVRATPIDIITAHLSERAAPLRDVVPGVPASLSSFVERLMAKEPSDRPSTYRQLIAELDDAIVPSAEGDDNIADDGAYVAQPTGVMGSLKQMGIVEIGQMLELQKKTAVVAVHPIEGAAGEVAFLDGQVKFAARGTLMGDEAFIQLTTLKDGFFRIFYDRPPPSQNVDKPISFLILESMRRADENAATKDAAPTASRPPADDVMNDRTVKDQPRPVVVRQKPLVQPVATKAKPATENVRSSSTSPRESSTPAKRTSSKRREEAATLPPPPELSPLDDDTILELSGDDPFGGKDTAILDRPQAAFERHELLSDDGEFETTLEHPLPVSGMGVSIHDIDDKTAAMPLMTLSDEAPSHRNDVTTLQPMLFTDERGTISAEEVVDKVKTLSTDALTWSVDVVSRFEEKLPTVGRFLRTPRGVLAMFLGVLFIALFAGVLTALVVERPLDVREVRARLARNDVNGAKALLVSAPPDTDAGVLELLRGHVFAKEGNVDHALASYRRAAKSRNFDAPALDFTLALLSDDARAEAALDALVEWPSPEVADRLAELAQDHQYALRTRAYQALSERGESARVDYESHIIKNLADAPTCRERRLALLTLTEIGTKSDRARKAVLDAAARGRENVCMERELQGLIPRK